MNPTLPPFVQDLLDRGVDPIDDSRTQEWLREHPDALPAFAALRRALIELPVTLQAVPPQAVRRAPMPLRPIVWLSASAAAAIVTLAVLATGQSDSSTPLPRPDFPATGGVVHCRAAATEIRGTSARSRVLVFGAPGIGTRRSMQRYKSLPTSSLSKAVTVRAMTITEEAMIP